MKAIALAALFTLLIFGLATLLFHFWRIERRAYALNLLFLVCLGGLAFTSLSTSDDLGFLPAELSGGPRSFDLACALFFFSSAFFGGVLQIYNLADRGFSLRILIDLQEQPQTKRTLESVFAGYSSGRGIAWMYQKRIQDMVDRQLITLRGDEVLLTARGTRLAQILAGLRRFYRVEGLR